MHQFVADSEDELTVVPGDVVEVVNIRQESWGGWGAYDAPDEPEEEGWIRVRVMNDDGTLEEGLVPESYCVPYTPNAEEGAAEEG